MKKQISHFPNYLQLDAMHCGPTCLRIIAKYYGRSYSLQTLRDKSFITRQGVSMLGISDAAESIGFRTQGLRITLDRLIEDMPLPCILHWNQNHFVVCYEITGKEGNHYFRISDPARGKYKIDEQGFRKCWCSTKDGNEEAGTAPALSPSPEFYEHEDERMGGNRNIGYFFRYLFPYKSQLLQLVIGIMLGSIFSLILPFLTQAVVDQGINNNNT